MRNRFKGLYLIDRVPEELWTEVCDIIQEAVIKTIVRKRNAKRQNGSLRRPYNSGEKKRSKRQREKGNTHIHLNAVLQRIARTDKKAFLSDQCEK